VVISEPNVILLGLHGPHLHNTFPTNMTAAEPAEPRLLEEISLPQTIRGSAPETLTQVMTAHLSQLAQIMEDGFIHRLYFCSSESFLFTRPEHRREFKLTVGCTLPPALRVSRPL